MIVFIKELVETKVDIYILPCAGIASWESHFSSRESSVTAGSISQDMIGIRDKINETKFANI